MPSTELVERYQRTQDAARRLEAEAAEVHELTKRLEILTKDAPAWYAGMGLEWRRELPWNTWRS
jgi:hypothetical protein